MTLDTTDRTGARATVKREPDHFTISVEGRQVGLADFSDRAGRRSFFHTEVDPAFQGRGLATILVAHALEATRADGLRIVAPCSMVADYIDRSGEYEDLVDRR
jgi:uncharacterized protein